MPENYVETKTLIDPKNPTGERIDLWPSATTIDRAKMGSTTVNVGTRIYGQHTIVSVCLVDGHLEVVRRYPSNMMYSCNPPRPAPDRVIKEIYRVQDGKIVLAETVTGKHTPAHTVDEKIEFPERASNDTAKLQAGELTEAQSRRIAELQANPDYPR